MLTWTQSRVLGIGSRRVTEVEWGEQGRNACSLEAGEDQGTSSPKTAAAMQVSWQSLRTSSNKAAFLFLFLFTSVSLWWFVQAAIGDHTFIKVVGHCDCLFSLPLPEMPPSHTHVASSLALLTSASLECTCMRSVSNHTPPQDSSYKSAPHFLFVCPL